MVSIRVSCAIVWCAIGTVLARRTRVRSDASTFRCCCIPESMEPTLEFSLSQNTSTISSFKTTRNVNQHYAYVAYYLNAKPNDLQYTSAKDIDLKEGMTGTKRSRYLQWKWSKHAVSDNAVYRVGICIKTRKGLCTGGLADESNTPSRCEATAKIVDGEQVTRKPPCASERRSGASKVWGKVRGSGMYVSDALGDIAGWRRPVLTGSITPTPGLTDSDEDLLLPEDSEDASDSSEE